MKSDDTIRILRIVDHDAQFYQNEQQGGTAILNHVDFTDPNYAEQLESMVFASDTGSDFIARCACGHIEENYKIGTICPICETPVSMSNAIDDDNLRCRNWLACPEIIKCGWMNPKAYLNIAEWLSYDRGRRNYIDDILDVTAEKPYDIQEVCPGVGGFQFLFDNFDRIMNFFIYDHKIISKRPETNSARIWLKLHRSRIFCRYIPILPSVINPIVSSDSGGANRRRYSDVTSDHVLTATASLSQLIFSPPTKNAQFNAEAVVYEAFKELVAYEEASNRKYGSVKKAIPRSHMFGGRFHWSFRAVIVPIVGPHNYYELHVPWKMAVNTLRVHLYGVLCREYNMSINEAAVTVRNALQKIDPLVEAIMDRFLKEYPGPGIACTWDRPPSIRDGSVTRKYWTKIKKDLHDATVGMTPIDVPLSNADFDGDNKAGIIIIESDMARAFQGLSPSSLIYNRNTGEITPQIGIHKTLSMTWNRFLGNI